MRVLVTGAAGRMGMAACKVLAADGWTVIAADLKEKADLGVEYHQADLRDRHAVEKLAAGGLDAVVHLGNYIDFSPPDPQMILGENVTMNINVLQSAFDHGARQMVFASSIQVLHSTPQLPAHSPSTPPAYLPLDSDSPARPMNPYALSKLTGELTLEYYNRIAGDSPRPFQAVALRLPWMLYMEELPKRAANWRNTPFIKQHGFAYMTYADAGALVGAILRSNLPGFRVYLPASRNNFLGTPAAELIQEFFPAVPLKGPIREFSLVDISRIERETGWSPKD